MKKIIIALAALATLSTASLARTDVDPRDRANGDINIAGSAFKGSKASVKRSTGSSVSTTSAFAVEGSAARSGSVPGETAFQRMKRLHNLYEFSGH
jgi:hypothetical protein